jgi:hypothetical protein
VQRHDPGLRTESEQGEQERHRAPERRQVLGAHVGEGVVAGVGLQHAEAEQDGDRADVGDQQVQVSGLPDLGDPVVGDDEEERRQRHRLPHHHEGIGVVGQHDHRHAGEKDVVFEAEQSRRRALALPEIAGGECRHAGRRGADHEQEEAGERVEAKVEGKPGQAERQHDDLGRGEHRGERDAGRSTAIAPPAGKSTLATQPRLRSANRPSRPTSSQPATTTSTQSR